MLIRVLYLAHDDQMLGGANRSLCALIESVSDCVKPVVIVPHKGEVYSFFTDHGIPCLSFPIPELVQHGAAKDLLLLRALKWPLRVIKKAIQKRVLLKCLKEKFPVGTIDIVHTNTAIIGVGQEVAETLGAKHIWHLREFINLDHGMKLMWGWADMYRRVHDSDATISISHVIQKHFVKNFTSFDYCIFNAVVERGEIEVNGKRENAFLFLGGLTKSKGIEEALRGFVVFSKAHPDYCLYIVGEGNAAYVSRLKEKVLKADCSDKVYFVGFQTEVRQYYQRCKGFLMCSRMEALGRTTIEAMNYGCVVIGRQSGGTAELIDNGRTGFLYSSDVELVAKMNFIASQEVCLIREAAHRYVQEYFTKEVYGCRMKKVYEEVLRKRKQSNF